MAHWAIAPLSGSVQEARSERQVRTAAMTRVDDERGRREIIEPDLAELKRQVAVLQSRIDEVEQRLGR